MNSETREITLPSGRTAVARKGKGRDLIRAHRAVADNPEPMALEFALIAELVQVDGKPIVYEDVLAMDLTDVLALQNEVTGMGGDGSNFTEAPAHAGVPAASSLRPQSPDLSASVSPSQS